MKESSSLPHYNTLADLFWGEEGGSFAEITGSVCGCPDTNFCFWGTNSHTAFPKK
jgi:hypothetical protein